MTASFVTALLAAGVALASLPASAQSTGDPIGAPGSPTGPRLPVPAVAQGAAPESLLLAARAAVRRGRLGEAEEALERAETRILDRQVAPASLAAPDVQPVVRDISAARRALTIGDRPAALWNIDDALQRLRQSEQAASTPVAIPAPRPGQTGAITAPRQADPPPAPTTTYASLPGHWQLEGARWVWIAPETTLRPVVTRSVVPNRYAWKDGRWVYEPQHYRRTGEE